MKVGFDINRASFRATFFDFEKVLTKAAAANRRGMARFGGAVRIRARRSIRTRKKSSKPGQAPSDHSRLLKENIFFGEEPNRGGVVIGPAAISTGPTTGIVSVQRPTETLEYGGSIIVKEYKINGTWRRAGTPGAVKSKAKGTRSRRVKIKARPYMGPAFKQVMPTANKFWKDSIR